MQEFFVLLSQTFCKFKILTKLNVKKFLSERKYFELKIVQSETNTNSEEKNKTLLHVQIEHLTSFMELLVILDQEMTKISKTKTMQCYVTLMKER